METGRRGEGAEREAGRRGDVVAVLLEMEFRAGPGRPALPVSSTVQYKRVLVADPRVAA